MIAALLLAALLGAGQTGSLGKGLILDAPLTDDHLDSATVGSNLTPFALQCDPVNTPTYGSDGVTFDAATDELDCGDVDEADITETSAFTASIWVDVSPTAAYPFIFSKSNNGTQGWDIFQNVGEDSQVRIRDGSSNTLTVNSGIAIDTGWHHIVLTYDGANTLEGWQDGVSYGTDNSPTLSGLDNSGSSFTLNQYANITAGSKAAFAKYWSRKLTDDEIGLLYSQGRKVVASMAGGLQKGLIFSAPLNEDFLSGSIDPSDVSGYGHQITGNGTPVFDANGVTLDGTTEYFDIAYNAAMPLPRGDGSTDEAFSVSVWVSHTGNAGDLISNNTGGDQVWWVYADGNERLYFSLYDDSTGGYAYCYTDASIVDGTPAHFVFTYDGRAGSTAYDGIEIYKNNVDLSCYGTKNGTYVAMESFETDWQIGKTGPNEWPGTVSQVKIWNRVITAAERGHLYNQGRRVIAAQTGDTHKNLIGSWPMRSDYAIGTLAADATPRNRDMTADGSATLDADSTHLDGSTQYWSYDEADYGSGDQAGTISVWFMPDDTPAASEILVSVSDYATGGGAAGRYMQLGFGAGLDVIFSLRDSASNRRIFTATDCNFVVGQWNLMVVESTNATYTAWCNNVQQTLSFTEGSNDGAWLGDLENIDGISIGTWQNNSSATNHFDGKISDVRYYDVAVGATIAGYIYQYGHRP